MADYITKIRTADGDKQIDYEALANLPTIKGAVNETVLASGTIPSDTAAWTNIGTSVSINTLRQWEKFIVVVKPATSCAVNLTCSVNNTYIVKNSAFDSTSFYFMLEWLDADKTVLNGWLLSGSAYVAIADEYVKTGTQAGLNFSNGNIGLPIAFHKMDSSLFDSNLQILVNKAQTAEGAWTIHGLVQ